MTKFISCNNPKVRDSSLPAITTTCLQRLHNSLQSKTLY